MDIRFQAGGPKLWKASVMLTFAYTGDDPSTICPEVEDACPWFSIAPGRMDFAGKSGELALFHGHPKQDIPRVLAIGLGKRDKFTLDNFRKNIAHAMAFCREKGLSTILLPVPSLMNLEADHIRLVEEAIYASFMGLYRFTKLKQTKDEDKEDPQWFALAFSEEHVPDFEHSAARRGERAAQSVALARDLANTPPNILTPLALAEAAQKMAKEQGIKCTVFDKETLTEMGFNTLLAVGQGSTNPPCMVVLEHAPKGHEDEDPVVFIGKGITFDAGGISIKPAAQMHLMKSDMSGAAAVVGAMQLIGQNMLERRVIGILACAENLPGGSAMRPGDVVKSFSGKTVEILNTDAEGRLVLCDAISYAQKEYNPAFMVDIATLTGACAVALGIEIAGLFSDDADFCQEIMSIGQVIGEPFWRLPLWEPYALNLRSEVADISHLGPREGGAINAALYLKAFVNKDIKWAHMDIAGCDWAFKKTSLSPVGAVGFGVRTLAELVRGDI